MPRKTAGIVGGIGPESTIAYYRSIVEQYRARVNDRSYPRVVINSIDVNALLDHVAAGRLDELARWLASEVVRLANAGADFALLAASTPHVVFDEIAASSRLPLISIVDAARDASEAAGVRKLLLLGTRFTMQARFYPAGFARSGIAVAVPNAAEQDQIHRIYVDELLNGIVRLESRTALQEIVARTRLGQGIDGVLLAGTELPLLISADTCAGLPVIDASKAHVDRAVSALLA